jgi:hypothetical protein
MISSAVEARRVMQPNNAKVYIPDLPEVELTFLCALTSIIRPRPSPFIYNACPFPQPSLSSAGPFCLFFNKLALSLHTMKLILTLAAAVTSARAYWLMGIGLPDSPDPQRILCL